MWDMVSALPLKAGELMSKEVVLNWFAAHYPKIKDSTIAAQLIRLSTNARGRVHHNIKPVDDDLFFQVDGSHFRLFDPQNAPRRFRRARPARPQMSLLWLRTAQPGKTIQMTEMAEPNSPTRPT